MDVDSAIRISCAFLQLINAVQPFFFFSSGDCNFERPYSECGYSQGKDDDFDWEQVNTKLRPSTDPWVPAGQSNLVMTVHTTLDFIGVYTLAIFFQT